MNKPHFLLLVLIVLCLSLATCATRPAGVPVSVLSPVYRSGPAVRGELVDAIPLATIAADEATAYLTPATLSLKIKPDLLVRQGFFAAVDRLKPGFSRVRQIRLHYWSEDPTGRPVQLSGLLMLPALEAGSGRALEILLICHGTQLLRERVPSRLVTSERLVGLVAAASGLAVMLPDYPGMGDSEGFHPYCLADSLGKAGVDDLRSRGTRVRDCSWGGSSTAPGTYVLGYSEGGYAAMAVLREMETRINGEFALKAGYPLAVPADMSGTMLRLMAGDQPASSPYYMLYTLLGWQRFYPGVFPLERLLKPEVVQQVLPLMDGQSHGSVVNARIAALQGVKVEQAVASRMLSAEGLDALRNPEGSELGRRIREALRQNDLYNWQPDPAVPILLAASPADELVPAVNSRIAASQLAAKGGLIQLTELSPNTHADAGIEAYALMLLDVWKRAGVLGR